MNVTVSTNIGQIIDIFNGAPVYTKDSVPPLRNVAFAQFRSIRLTSIYVRDGLLLRLHNLQAVINNIMIYEISERTRSVAFIPLIYHCLTYSCC